MKRNNNEIMKPKIDFVFKRLFGTMENINNLKYLLNTILEIDRNELEDIEFIQNEFARESPFTKSSLLDIIVKLKDGRKINIEIQICNVDDMVKRSLLYWAKMYSRDVKINDEYNTISKCISINILDYNITESKKAHSIYHITEDEDGYKLTDMLEIHYLELPKFNINDKYYDKHKELALLIQFLKATNKGEITMLAEKSAELKEVCEKLNQITDDDDLWYAYLSREKALRDEISRYKFYENAEERGFNNGLERGLKQGIEQGIEKGIEQGIEQGVKQGIEQGEINKTKELVLNMINENIDINTIAKISCLSIEEIKSIIQLEK